MKRLAIQVLLIILGTVLVGLAFGFLMTYTDI